MKHRSHFAALDGWRGLAAVAVALLHCPAYGYFYGLPFVRHSGLFVDFFFVLSGFVIAYNYGDQIGNFDELFVFMRRRFARLWPLHVSILLFLFALELVKFAGVDARNSSPAFSGPTSIPALVSNLALAQGLFHAGDTWNGPAQTISLEFYTYLVFAIGCILSAGRYQLAGIALFAASALVIGVGFGDLSHLGRFDILRCIYNFSAGTLVYWIFVRSAYPSTVVATFIESTAVAAVVIFVTFDDTSLELVLTPLVFGLLVYIFAFERGFLSRLNCSAPIVRLGVLSYSIYMIHGPSYLLLEKFVKTIQGPSWLPMLKWIHNIDGSHLVLAYEPKIAMDIFAIIWIAAVIAVSNLTYRFIEMPGQKFFNPKPTRGAVPKPVARGPG